MRLNSATTIGAIKALVLKATSHPALPLYGMRSGSPQAVLYKLSPSVPSLLPVRLAYDQTEEQMRLRGTSWRGERERLEKVGLVAVWLPISEGDVGQQIPQAVRAVSALAEVGHDVIIASSGGFTSSGAVVAG